MVGLVAMVEGGAAGHEIVVLDNLCNSRKESLRRVTELTGRTFAFVEGDIRDRAALDALFRMHAIDSVIHFAGLKAVGESVAKPLAYYDNNVTGTQVLLRCLQRTAVRRFVFSSSATVYGDPESVPLSETSRTGPTNPYGRSKWMIEFMLGDLAAAEPGWAIGILRYFNPVGAHASGRIGEDPQGTPNNLLPFVAQVAVGRRPHVNVWGNDYATPDGTGVRDYIHVVDLALGHIKALERLQRHAECRAINLGTGVGYSVLDMLRAFEQASGKPVPYKLAERRAGDIAACYADPAQALELLGWQAQRDLQTMCVDAWRWQSSNPQGYRTTTP